MIKEADWWEVRDKSFDGNSQWLVPDITVIRGTQASQPAARRCEWSLSLFWCIYKLRGLLTAFLRLSLPLIDPPLVNIAIAVTCPFLNHTYTYTPRSSPPLPPRAIPHIPTTETPLWSADHRLLNTSHLSTRSPFQTFDTFVPLSSS